MMKKSQLMKNSIFLILLGLILSITSVKAQDVPVEYNPTIHGQGYGYLPEHIVQFKFKDELSQVPFLISFDQKNWSKFTLKKNHSVDIYLQKRKKAVFEICTKGKGCVRYYVNGANSYQIFWNGEKWDLSKL